MYLSSVQRAGDTSRVPSHRCPEEEVCGRAEEGRKLVPKEQAVPAPCVYHALTGGGLQREQLRPRWAHSLWVTQPGKCRSPRSEVRMSRSRSCRRCWAFRGKGLSSGSENGAHLRTPHLHPQHRPHPQSWQDSRKPGGPFRPSTSGPDFTKPSCQEASEWEELGVWARSSGCPQLAQPRVSHVAWQKPFSLVSALRLCRMGPQRLDSSSPEISPCSPSWGGGAGDRLL